MNSALQFTFPPYSVSPNLVCPYLSYLSANYSIPSSQRCPTYPLPYLSKFYQQTLQHTLVPPFPDYIIPNPVQLTIPLLYLFQWLMENPHLIRRFKPSCKNSYIVFRLLWDLVFMSHINSNLTPAKLQNSSNRILFGLSLRALCVAAWLQGSMYFGCSDGPLCRLGTCG